MKKRFPALTALLTLLLCVTVRAAEPRLEVHLPAGPVEAGEEFTVTVDLTGNPGILNIQFTLAFDKERMECEEAKIGEFLSQQAGASAVNANAQSGAILAAASADVITGDGQAGIFRFRAKENLSDFHFSIERITLTDRNKNKLDVVVTDAGISNESGAADSGNNAANDGNASDGAASGNAPANSGTASDAGNSGSGSVNSGNVSDTGASGNAPANSGTTSDAGNSGSAPANNGNASDAGNSGNVSDTGESGNAPDNSGSGTTSTNPPPPFRDILGTWAEGYIRTATERNLFQGYADGTFRPDNRLTRAQFMMVLWNLAGRPAPTRESPFLDMRTQIENFQNAVSWAYAMGYVSGTSPTTFSPGEPLTRQAAVKILFAYNGSNRGPEALLTQFYDNQYADSGLISSWAKDAMYWAVYQQILTGTSATTLNPGGTVTRAQLAAVMVRYTNRFPA